MTEPAANPARDAEQAPDRPGGRRLVGVQFRRAAAMIYDFDAADLALQHDQRVVVETERGEAIGWVVGEPQVREPHATDGAVRRVLRVAVGDDLERRTSQVDTEREALRHCAQRARALGLDMKVIAAEWSHSADKATFYFSSEDRVDFRQLVRELAQRHRIRVEMRQVGPRDEAKIIGAIGPCGRETCCSSWMRAFTPVSIKMAKDQGLALNPQKVTGVCGRLLCCLAYEQDTYKELRKALPKVGKQVQTAYGVGKIIDVFVLRGTLRVVVEGGDLKELAPNEVAPLGAQLPQEPEEAEGPELDGDVIPAAVEAKARRDERPRADAPRADRPREERPRTDRAGTDRPRGERPRVEAPRTDRPHDAQPPAERARTEGPRERRPEQQRPRKPHEQRPAKPEGQKPSEPRPEAPKGEQARAEAPAREGQKPHAQQQRPPKGEQGRPQQPRPQQPQKAQKPQNQPAQGKQRQGPQPQKPTGPRPERAQQPKAAPQPPAAPNPAPNAAPSAETTPTDPAATTGAGGAPAGEHRRKRHRRGRGGGGGSAGGGPGPAAPGPDDT